MRLYPIWFMSFHFSFKFLNECNKLWQSTVFTQHPDAFLHFFAHYDNYEIFTGHLHYNISALHWNEEFLSPFSQLELQICWMLAWLWLPKGSMCSCVCCVLQPFPVSHHRTCLPCPSNGDISSWQLPRAAPNPAGILCQFRHSDLLCLPS